MRRVMARESAANDRAGDDLALDIRVISPGKLDVAARLLAHAMLNNPLHIEIFGSDSEQRERRLLRFFGLVLPYVQANGEILGAYIQGELTGVLGMIKPGRCRPTWADKLWIGPLIAASNPPAVTLRIVQWLMAWSRNDSTVPHWHIGPLAVLPAYRRRGIARRLMTHCCQCMDALGAVACLETDLEVNVGFYQTLGFAVRKQVDVLGVPNWFMCRPVE